MATLSDIPRVAFSKKNTAFAFSNGVVKTLLFYVRTKITRNRNSEGLACDNNYKFEDEMNSHNKLYPISVYDNPKIQIIWKEESF